MVIDASALVAILKGEPERAGFLLAVARASVKRISPVNWFEAAIVADRGGPLASAALEDIIKRAHIEITPVEIVHMMLARDAWQKFGKGRHGAGLNLGDCFAYALAKHAHEPLLFKGDDFRKTDITAAI